VWGSDGTCGGLGPAQGGSKRHTWGSKSHLRRPGPMVVVLSIFTLRQVATLDLFSKGEWVSRPTVLLDGSILTGLVAQFLSVRLHVTT
jgi:hypothetical protein